MSGILKSRIIRLLVIVSILAILALAFYAGMYFAQSTLEPQVIIAFGTNTTDKVVGEVVNDGEIITQEIVYRPIEMVMEPVEYESVESAALNRLENSRLLRYFRELGELEQWLETVELPGADSNVAIEEINQRIKSLDCDDYALMLQGKALRDGYMMSFEIIHSGEYNSLFKQGQIPDGTIHAINLVIIGNKVYYIEPKNHEIVFVANLD